MATPSETRGADDPFDLNRFLRAQEGDYKYVLSEIKDGQKRTHWMWYIFPQIGLVGSPKSGPDVMLVSLA
jgi:uncharacterized protein (DUF1810 family)